MRKYLLFLLLFNGLISAHGFENLVVESEQQFCFAKAMVGMDSVINASMGVPPEHALHLVAPNGNMQVLEEKNSMEMLNIILHAYFWKDSPHSYAVKVFYNCAKNVGSESMLTQHTYKKTVK